MAVAIFQGIGRLKKSKNTPRCHGFNLRNLQGMFLEMWRDRISTDSSKNSSPCPRHLLYLCLLKERRERKKQTVLKKTLQKTDAFQELKLEPEANSMRFCEDRIPLNLDVHSLSLLEWPFGGYTWALYTPCSNTRN